MLENNISAENINIFSKKYLIAITKTTRLLNIIENSSFKKEIHHAVNNMYKNLYLYYILNFKKQYVKFSYFGNL